MSLTRREWLAACAGAFPTLAALPCLGDEPKPPARSSLGVVEHSYTHRFAADRQRGGKDRIDDPIAFVEYCAQLGAGGVQMALGVRDENYCKRLKDTLDSHAMSLEVSVHLPRNQTQIRTFADELSTASSSGAFVARTALLSGRRYETFTTVDQFQEFSAHISRSLKLVKNYIEPRGFNIRIAIENHKDLRTDELVALLEKTDSYLIGACVDTGNSIALLEDPMETVEKLAPWAFSTHLKDMAVEEYLDGFLLSEVPLGTGFLDLPRIVRVLRAAHPEVRFNLEMITRDPLKIPCLTPGYWTTLDGLSGRSLAQTLRLIQRHAAKQPLPRVNHLGDDERLKAEDDNVRRCLEYAREHLGMS